MHVLTVVLSVFIQPIFEYCSPGPTTQILSSLSPKRDCSPNKGVNSNTRENTHPPARIIFRDNISPPKKLGGAHHSIYSSAYGIGGFSKIPARPFDGRIASHRIAPLGVCTFSVIETQSQLRFFPTIARVCSAFCAFCGTLPLVNTPGPGGCLLVRRRVPHFVSNLFASRLQAVCANPPTSCTDMYVPFALQSKQAVS